MSKKRRIENQEYDQYWDITVEYTDIYGSRFNNTLRMIIDYIDEHKVTEYIPENYQELQGIISNVYHKADDASTRKSINQFIKLGFVKPYLLSYNPKCRKFINEIDKDKKRSIFSEIFYENASLSSSVDTDLTYQNEIKFLLKTLAYHPNKVLTKDDLIALMCTPNFYNIGRGYLTVEELEEQKRFSERINFEKKKYNQISYLFGFLNKINNIKANKDTGISFINSDDVEIDTTRDPIRYSIYKTQLKNESRKLFGSEVCYIDLLTFVGLTASHIKDSAVCLREGNIDEAYDYENGLLLSQQNDMMFDHYLITIDENGHILTNDKEFLDNTEYLNRLKNTIVDSRILTDNRKRYLIWHRNKFKERLQDSK